MGKRKRKKRGKRIRHRSQADVGDIDLSRLFLEQPTSSTVAEMGESHARMMGDVGKLPRSNPFGDTRFVVGPAASASRSRGTKSVGGATSFSRASFFDDLVEDEE